MCTYRYIRKYIYINVYTYMHVFIYIYIYEQEYTHIHIFIYKYIYMCIYLNTYIYIPRVAFLVLCCQQHSTITTSFSDSFARSSLTASWASRDLRTRQALRRCWPSMSAFALSQSLSVTANEAIDMTGETVEPVGRFPSFNRAHVAPSLRLQLATLKVMMLKPRKNARLPNVKKIEVAWEDDAWLGNREENKSHHTSRVFVITSVNDCWCVLSQDWLPQVAPAASSSFVCWYMYMHINVHSFFMWTRLGLTKMWKIGDLRVRRQPTQEPARQLYYGTIWM